VKGCVDNEPFKAAVEEVPDPTIQHPNNVIVRRASTAIRGSDLHMCDGRSHQMPRSHEPRLRVWLSVLARLVLTFASRRLRR
jgi:threonine dehydrogenase-like Zn-dependent dehydrogenase